LTHGGIGPRVSPKVVGARKIRLIFPRTRHARFAKRGGCVSESMYCK
jgi:hypothetical protein